MPPASNTPEAPAVSQPGRLPSSGAQSQSGGASSAHAEPAPSAPEPEPEPDPETITVTVSVLCTLAVGNPNLNPGVTVPSDGVMVSGLSLELTPGQTAFDSSRPDRPGAGLYRQPFEKERISEGDRSI